MIQEIMLVLAVCTDMFFTAFSYGRNGIKIPLRSSAVISLTGAAILTIALEFSELIGRFIPEKLCIYAGSAILFIIGAIYLFKNCIRNLLKCRLGNCKNTQIQIFIDECTADRDNSKELSLGEAFVLSISLSVDSLATGTGAGLTGTGVLRTGIMALIGGITVMKAGELAGRKLKSEKNGSCIGGAVLIILAVLRFFQ